MKKLLLMVASLLLCLGMTTVASHGSCSTGSCHTGCGIKKADCGATCNETRELESRKATVKCPRQITVYDEVPVMQTREKVVTSCVCPEPKVGFTEWSKASCQSKRCGHCESCRHNRRHNHNEAAEVTVVEEEKTSKQTTRAEKKSAAKEARLSKRNNALAAH